MAKGTVVQKIIDAHYVAGAKIPGQPVAVRIDQTLTQDATGTMAYLQFEAMGIENYLIEIGGEIYAKGEKPTGQPWIIGIDSPREGNYIPGNDLIIKLKMKNRGLATSGNYRKFYTDSTGRKIVHTINPITGEPVVSSLLSATVKRVSVCIMII